MSLMRAVSLSSALAPPVLAQDEIEERFEKGRQEGAIVPDVLNPPGPLSGDQPGDRVFFEGDIKTNCDEAFRVLKRLRSVPSSDPLFDDPEFQSELAEAEGSVRICIEDYRILPRGDEDPGSKAQDSSSGDESKAKELPRTGGPSGILLLALGAGALLAGRTLLLRKLVGSTSDQGRVVKLLRKLMISMATLVSLLVAFTPPVLAQEEVRATEPPPSRIEEGGVFVEGDVIIDCEMFFEALERYRNNPPSDPQGHRDFEQAQGYVELCTERGVVPPFDESYRIRL